LTTDQLETFEKNGYLVVEDILDPERDLAPVWREYETVLDGVVDRLVEEGRLQSRYEDLEFGDRYTTVCLELNESIYPYFDISLPPGEIKKESPCHTGPAVFALLTNERLLDAVESIIGDEILSNPVQHVRVKLPARGLEAGLDVTTYWHQDIATLTEDAHETQILTVWSPLADCDEENGCLMVIPRSHAGVLRHCAGEGGSPASGGIPISDLPAKPVPVPMKAGSVLIMHRQTPHAALPNRTDRIRFSFDLRYQPADQPTGRDAFPGFLARSTRSPDAVLRSPADWSAMWDRARSGLLGSSQQHGFELWPVC
jgi:ectoine hydroxylase-related dioxygenase (phytanoyl-CoA dioxygenase family)